MKGVIFTSFISMVEDNHDYRLVDTIINESKVKSDGIYTNIGTYDFEELVKLISLYCEKTNTPLEDAIYNFGVYLFDKLMEGHKVIGEKYDSLIDLILNIQNTIHVEVKKIYHDAKLPSIIVERISSNQIKMVYSSERGLAKLAFGLLNGAANYFNEKIEIEVIELSEKQDFAHIVISVSKK